MKVEILFDKEAMNKDLRIGWGVSFLIDERILFDTGENGHWLLENIRNLENELKIIKLAILYLLNLWEI